ncbi:MAG: BatD family protein [Bacteroidota bacterium]
MRSEPARQVARAASAPCAAALIVLLGAGAASASVDGGSPQPRHPAKAAVNSDSPDAPTVTARLDRAQAHVGDPITLTITAVSRQGVPVNLPNVVELGEFSLLSRSESNRDLGDGHARREFSLRVAAYEPGPQTVPSIEVTYLGPKGDVRQARTEPLPIKIASLIANEPEPAMKTDAPPVQVWKRDLTLVIVVGGLLAAGIGGLVVWLIARRLRRRIIVRPGPPPRPAHEIALERLDRLGAYGFLENADNRPFYFAVSEVIRDYLGGRFGFDSLELTTDELIDHLRRRAGGVLLLGEIEGWLSACDLVKFAKVSPTATEARGTLENAIRIVESTRPRPEPSAVPAPSRPAAVAGGGPHV